MKKDLYSEFFVRVLLVFIGISLAVFSCGALICFLF